MSMRQKELSLLTECLESVNLWKNAINEHLPPSNERNDLEKHLKEIVQDYCMIEDISKKSTNALEELNKSLDNDTNNTITNQSIDKLYQEKLQEINQGSSRFNPNNHKIWQQIFKGQLDSDVQAVESTRPRPEDVEFTQLDDSLSCRSVFAPPKDPVSQTMITNPYKSAVCGHIFEHRFILQYIKSNKKDVKCPYRGCRNNNMKPEELFEDLELKSKIAEYLERNGNNSDDNEDDEQSD